MLKFVIDFRKVVLDCPQLNLVLWESKEVSPLAFSSSPFRDRAGGRAVPSRRNLGIAVLVYPLGYPLCSAQITTGPLGCPARLATFSPVALTVGFEGYGKAWPGSPSRLTTPRLAPFRYVLGFAACSVGPGLWPGPRRQARWAGRGLQGQRRAEDASRAAGCEAPLRLGGASPDNAWRSGSLAVTSLRLPGAPRALASARPWRRRARQRDTAADRRRPVTGAAVRAVAAP